MAVRHTSSLWACRVLIAGILLLAGLAEFGCVANQLKLPSHFALKKELKARGTSLKGKELDDHVKEILQSSKNAAFAVTHPDSRYGQFNRIKNRMRAPNGLKPHDRHRDLAKGMNLVIRKSFNEVDTNGDGEISLDEQMEHVQLQQDSMNPTVIQEVMKRRLHEEDLKPKYKYVEKKHFDKLHSEFIDGAHDERKEVREKLNSLKDRISKIPEAERTASEKQQLGQVDKQLGELEHLNQDHRKELANLEAEGKGDTPQAKKLRETIASYHPFSPSKLVPKSKAQEERIRKMKRNTKPNKSGETPGDESELVELMEQTNFQQSVNQRKMDPSQLRQGLGRMFKMQDFDGDGTINFIEYYWRMKQQVADEHKKRQKQFDEEHYHSHMGNAHGGYYTHDGHWIAATNQDEVDKEILKFDAKEKEDMLMEWEKEL